jgi:hypothetical protein
MNDIPTDPSDGLLNMLAILAEIAAITGSSGHYQYGIYKIVTQQGKDITELTIGELLDITRRYNKFYNDMLDITRKYNHSTGEHHEQH